MASTAPATGSPVSTAPSPRSPVPPSVSPSSPELLTASAPSPPPHSSPPPSVAKTTAPQSPSPPPLASTPASPPQKSAPVAPAPSPPPVSSSPSPQSEQKRPPPPPDTPAPSAPSSPPPPPVAPAPSPPPVYVSPSPPLEQKRPPPDTPAPSAPSSPPKLVAPAPSPPPVYSSPSPPSEQKRRPPQPDTPAPSAPSFPPPLVAPAPFPPPVSSSFPSPQSVPLPESSTSPPPPPPVTPAPSPPPSPPPPVEPAPSPLPSPPPSSPVSTSPTPSLIRSSHQSPSNLPPTRSENPSPPPPSLQAAESPTSLPPPPPPKKSPSPPSYQPAPPSPISSSLNSSDSPSPTQVIGIPPSKNETGNSTSPTPAAAENSSSAGGGGTSTALVVTIGVVAGLLLLGLIVIVLFLKMRKKKVAHLSSVYVMPPSRNSSGKTGRGSSGSDFVSVSPESGGGLGNSRPWFTYEELSKATDGFSAQNLLGQGGFGSVYKGSLVDGREVAVKQLMVGGGQGEREFRAEVEIISRIHHRHLVSLVGYCISESRRLLVYDYVPNNTLYFHLHGKDREVMDWATRLKVAAGAAHGIAYLHEDCRPRVIHRDIKSSNILLDNNFEARVSDFGLAKLDFDANTHISTRVMGTFGYMAPEYATTGKLTDKSDVYSLGVVLLELITGREPVDTSRPLGDESLVEWARSLLSHVVENKEFDILVDPRLGRNYAQSEMIQLIEAAAACVRHSAIKRPRMGQVVRVLDSITGADLTNGMRLGESEVQTSPLRSNEIRLFQRMAFDSHGHTSDFLSPSSSSQGALSSR